MTTKLDDLTLVLPATPTSQPRIDGGEIKADKSGGPSSGKPATAISELTIILPRGVKLTLEFWDMQKEDIEKGKVIKANPQNPMYVDFSNAVIDTRGRNMKDAICAVLP